jgi:hypothetical protein
MRPWRARAALPLLRWGAALLATLLAFAGAAGASGLVNVQISPDGGYAGTRISVTATGFRDQKLASFTVPPYYGEIAVDQTVVATDLPVTPDGASMSVVAKDIPVEAAPGDHTIVVTVYAKEAGGRRYIDDGGHVFRVYDPGPAHPLSVSLQVALPQRALGGVEIVAQVSLRSGPGDKTKVGLQAVVLDGKGNSVLQLQFPQSADQGGQGYGTDRIEMMRPGQSEQFSSAPFRLPPGTWRVHFTLLVNNVAHDLDRSVTVAREIEPQPHKLPPNPRGPLGNPPGKP